MIQNTQLFKLFRSSTMAPISIARTTQNYDQSYENIYAAMILWKVLLQPWRFGSKNVHKNEHEDHHQYGGLQFYWKAGCGRARASDKPGDCYRCLCRWRIRHSFLFSAFWWIWGWSRVVGFSWIDRWIAACRCRSKWSYCHDTNQCRCSNDSSHHWLEPKYF